MERQQIAWSDCPIIRREPGKMGGVPNIAGMRITPEAILDNYEDGATIEEIANEIFPGVSENQVRTILKYAADSAGLGRYQMVTSSLQVANS